MSKLGHFKRFPFEPEVNEVGSDITPKRSGHLNVDAIEERLVELHCFVNALVAHMAESSMIQWSFPSFPIVYNN